MDNNYDSNAHGPRGRRSIALGVQCRLFLLCWGQRGLRDQHSHRRRRLCNTRCPGHVERINTVNRILPRASRGRCYYSQMGKERLKKLANGLVKSMELRNHTVSTVDPASGSRPLHHTVFPKVTCPRHPANRDPSLSVSKAGTDRWTAVTSGGSTFCP